jgi:hypothetical protein
VEPATDPFAWGSITRFRLGGLPGRRSSLGDLLGRLPVHALPVQMLDAAAQTLIVGGAITGIGAFA